MPNNTSESLSIRLDADDRAAIDAAARTFQESPSGFVRRLAVGAARRRLDAIYDGITAPEESAEHTRILDFAWSPELR